MSGLRSIVAFLRRLRRSTARSTTGAACVGSSSTSSISDFSKKPCSSSISPSSSSTSARAVATSAYVSTPVAWPLTTRSFTSSSSCRSATDILFLAARRAQREGAGPIQTIDVHTNATDSEVKRPEAESPLISQSTSWFPSDCIECAHRFHVPRTPTTRIPDHGGRRRSAWKPAPLAAGKAEREEGFGRQAGGRGEQGGGQGRGRREARGEGAASVEAARASEARGQRQAGTHGSRSRRATAASGHGRARKVRGPPAGAGRGRRCATRSRSAPARRLTAAPAVRRRRHQRAPRRRHRRSHGRARGRCRYPGDPAAPAASVAGCPPHWGLRFGDAWCFRGMLAPMAPGAKHPPRCLIVDEHPVVRAGVRAVLEQAFDHVEISDADSIEHVTDVAKDGTPDVVIIDPWRAGVDVGDIVGRLQGQVKAPIVVFTSDGGARLLSDALKAGVKGYVRKDSPSADLVRAIEAARTGEFYVDPGLSSTIVLDEGDRTLSARQREILQMLADGMQTDVVAEKLGLSTETVRTHTKRILAKLEASTRTQAVAIGIRHGLIE